MQEGVQRLSLAILRTLQYLSRLFMQEDVQRLSSAILRTKQHVSRPVIREIVQSSSFVELHSPLSQETLHNLPAQAGGYGTEQAAYPASMHNLLAQAGGYVAGQDDEQRDEVSHVSTQSADADSL